MSGQLTAVVRSAVAACAVLLLAPAVAAAANPPTISTGFTSDTVPQNGTVGVYFTIQNNDSSPLTGVSFSDTLPVGMVVASPNEATTDCGGTLTATPGSSTISFANGTIQAPQPPDFIGGSCNLAAEVHVTAEGGTLSNATGPASANESGPGAASNTASVKITPAAIPPSLALSFDAAQIPLHGGTTLTLTISNPNQAGTLENIVLDDPLPAGLVVATAPALGGTCSSNNDGTVAAAPGGTEVTAHLALAAGTSCTVTAALTGTAPGTQNDVTGAPTASYDDGTGNLQPQTGTAASGSITVVGPPSVGVAFGAQQIAVGAQTTLTIAISNPNKTTALSGIGLNDTLPGGLTLTGGSGSCAGTPVTAAPGTNTITLGKASLAPGAGCTFAATVRATSDGTKVDSTGAVTSTEGGAGTPMNAALLVASPPVATIGFTPGSVLPTRAVRLTLTVRNPNPDVSLTGVSLIDPLPHGLAVARPNRLRDNCAGATVTAAAGSSRISLAGAALPPAGACTVTGIVLASEPGQLINTTAAPSAAQTGAGQPASARLTILVPSNRFSLKGISVLSHGRFRLKLVLPGPGRIDVLITAKQSNLARKALTLRPARGSFVYAHTSVSAHEAETVSFVVGPNAAGRRLLSHHRGSVRLGLAVGFTPLGGAARILTRGGLRPRA